MDYEALLEEAYESVKPIKESERFEVLRVNGHHEGSKTIITNFSQVALCIRRSPAHLMKFLCKELASSCEVSGDRLIMSRKLSSKDVNAKVQKYVDKYVSCSKCGKPDTELVDEGAKTHLKCLACCGKQEVYRF